MPRSKPRYAEAPDGLPARVVREWARRKHRFLDRYAEIFATGMKKSFTRRAYLDLFAGPGICCEAETGEFYDGSPLIGLRRNFTDHIYVDLDATAAAALDVRSGPWKRDRYITVIPGDCNRVIDAVVDRLPPYGITFAFIDPTNLQIRFDTIRKLTSQKRVDLVVTFFAGLMLRVGGLPQPRLDAFFGTRAWQNDPRFLGVDDGLPTLSGQRPRALRSPRKRDLRLRPPHVQYDPAGCRSGSARAAEWWLERRMPESFGPKVEVRIEQSEEDEAAERGEEWLDLRLDEMAERLVARRAARMAAEKPPRTRRRSS